MDDTWVFKFAWFGSSAWVCPHIQFWCGKLLQNASEITDADGQAPTSGGLKTPHRQYEQHKDKVNKKNCVFHKFSRIFSLPK